MIDKKDKDVINRSVVRIFSEIISINPFIPFDEIPPKRSQGTGFFIDNKGYILTCSHVVEHSINILIDIPNISTEKFQCELIHIIPKFDIALLKVKNYKNKYFVELGDSDKLEISDEVFAVGFPKSINSNGGNNIKYTLGIISGHQEGLIQTDTPINSGNSGGPLFRKNKVIGINSKKLIGDDVSNIGYAVPINYFNHIKDKKSIIVHRPLLNCVINNTNNKICEHLTNNSGVYISKVYKNSIFEDIKKEFILTKFDNYKIDNYGYLEKRWLGEKIHLKNILNFYNDNTKVKIEYFINKKKYNKEIKFKPNRPTIYRMFSNYENIDYLIIGGAIFMNLYLDHETRINSIHNANDFYEEKVLITYILPNTQFNILNNIEIGSVIKKINDTQINNLNDIRKIIKKPFKMNNLNILKIQDNDNNVIIMELKEIIKANKQISKLYRFNTKNIL
jgi:S1-C subfamily serine protease|tara:strand:+ start:3675 stop:5021 length:1347 start_codon:yes stop_codon:yes gene_type:complete